MLKTKCSLALAMIVALLSIATTPVAGAARAVANREGKQPYPSLDNINIDQQQMFKHATFSISLGLVPSQPPYLAIQYMLPLPSIQSHHLHPMRVF